MKKVLLCEVYSPKWSALLFLLFFQLASSAQSNITSGCATSSITTVTACNSYTWNGKTFYSSTVNSCIGGIQALDGSNKFYRYATVYDWDCCLFGGNSVFEGGFSYPVDGHFKIQYDCNGVGVVVEATGNYASYLGTTRNDNFGFSTNPTWKSLITDAGCCNADGSKIFVQLTGLVTNGFTMHFTNSAGCDSAATLMLTINKKVTLGSVTSQNNILCNNETTTLNANNVTGTNAIVNWYSGSNATGTFFGTGTTLPNIGSGKYYARATGICGTPVQKFIIIYSDTVRPTISCPAEITQTITGCSKYITTDAPVYDDNCAVKSLVWTTQGATVLSSASSGIKLLGRKNFNAGNTLVTYTIKDSSGNTNSCSFHIVVNTNATCFTRNIAKENSITEQSEKLFTAKLIPNMTASSFGLKIESVLSQQVHVIVYNSIGEKIKQLNISPARVIYLGEFYQKGVYFFVIRQGENKITLKGIKN